jgi:hypothetical protein
LSYDYQKRKCEGLNGMDLNESGRKVLHVIQLAGVPILEGQIRMIDQGVPHRPSSLPKGTVGIYLFFFQYECVKIGKAGSKSNARFLSQHYNPESSQSNLAKSIVLDNNFSYKQLSKENIGDWMKSNLRRVDFLIDESLGIFVPNFVEAFLHLCLKPRYEGV